MPIIWDRRSSAALVAAMACSSVLVLEPNTTTPPSTTPNAAIKSAGSRLMAPSSAADDQYPGEARGGLGDHDELAAALDGLGILLDLGFQTHDLVAQVAIGVIIHYHRSCSPDGALAKPGSSDPAFHPGYEATP